MEWADFVLTEVAGHEQEMVVIGGRALRDGARCRPVAAGERRRQRRDQAARGADGMEAGYHRRGHRRGGWPVGVCGGARGWVNGQSVRDGDRQGETGQVARGCWEAQTAERCRGGEQGGGHELTCGMLPGNFFAPRSGLDPVEGVPANRVGHGIPQKVVIEELTAAGLQLEKTVNDWPDDDYCVLFVKK